jgi:hypothetical protein
MRSQKPSIAARGGDTSVRESRFSCLARQLTVAVQQLHDGEEEEPEADHRGEDAQDKDGGAAVVQVTFPGSKRIQVWIRDPPKSDAGAEGGHEQEGDADDDPDVEHRDSSFCRPEWKGLRHN